MTGPMIWRRAVAYNLPHSPKNPRRSFQPDRTVAGVYGLLALLASSHPTLGLADDQPRNPANTAPVDSGPADSEAVPEVTITATSPLLGTGIDADKVPNATRVLKASDLTANGGQASLTNALQAQVGSVNLAYTDVGFEDGGKSLHLSFAYANNALSGMGETPAAWLDRDRRP
jgi:hypothetical protein